MSANGQFSGKESTARDFFSVSLCSLPFTAFLTGYPPNTVVVTALLRITAQPARKVA